MVPAGVNILQDGFFRAILGGQVEDESEVDIQVGVGSKLDMDVQRSEKDMVHEGDARCWAVWKIGSFTR
jgi:hypothetical protein